MSDLRLSLERQQQFLEQLRSHGRALAVELLHIEQRSDAIFTYYGRMRRPGLLGSLFGLMYDGYKTISGWRLGELKPARRGLLYLGQDGEIYVLHSSFRHEARPLSEVDVQTLQDAQEVRRLLHALEERTDVFNKLRDRAES